MSEQNDQQEQNNEQQIYEQIYETIKDELSVYEVEKTPNLDSLNLTKDQIEQIKKGGLEELMSIMQTNLRQSIEKQQIELQKEKRRIQLEKEGISSQSELSKQIEQNSEGIEENKQSEQIEQSQNQEVQKEPEQANQVEENNEKEAQIQQNTELEGQNTQEVNTIKQTPKANQKSQNSLQNDQKSQNSIQLSQKSEQKMNSGKVQKQEQSEVKLSQQSIQSQQKHSQKSISQQSQNNRSVTQTGNNNVEVSYEVSPLTHQSTLNFAGKKDQVQESDTKDSDKIIKDIHLLEGVKIGQLKTLINEESNEQQMYQEKNLNEGIVARLYRKQNEVNNKIQKMKEEKLKEELKFKNNNVKICKGSQKIVSKQNKTKLEERAHQLFQEKQLKRKEMLLQQEKLQECVFNETHTFQPKILQKSETQRNINEFYNSQQSWLENKGKSILIQQLNYKKKEQQEITFCPKINKSSQCLNRTEKIEEKLFHDYERILEKKKNQIEHDQPLFKPIILPKSQILAKKRREQDQQYFFSMTQTGKSCLYDSQINQ